MVIASLPHQACILGHSPVHINSHFLPPSHFIDDQTFSLLPHTLPSQTFQHILRVLVYLTHLESWHIVQVTWAATYYPTTDKPPLISTFTQNGPYERCRPIHRHCSDCLHGTTNQRANIIIGTNIDQLGSKHHHTREQRERSIQLNQRAASVMERSQDASLIILPIHHTHASRVTHMALRRGHWLEHLQRTTEVDWNASHVGVG